MTRRACITGRRRSSRGIAFIVALAVVVVIASVLMVLARHVQTEGRASANQAAAIEARWIADGVTRALLVELTRDPGLALTGREPDTVRADAGELGDGLYWLLLPDPDDEDRYELGIASEAARINLNTADADMLDALHPDLTPQIAASILAWRGDGVDDADGAPAGESSYYQTLPRPYRAKQAPLETVGELLLVRDIDHELLHGRQRAAREALAFHQAPAQPLRIGRGIQRGIAPHVTVHSVEPNVSSATGQPRVNVNSESISDIRDALAALLASDDEEATADGATDYAAMIAEQRPYANVIDMLVRLEPTDDDAQLLYDRLTTTDAATRRGLVDVTAASSTLLEALPGLEPGDGDRLVNARESIADPTASPVWIIDALGPDKAVAIGDLITTRSLQFSADILAVSGDGRAFHRVRVVLDVSPTLNGGAARIVHSEELTHLGWPLDRGILDALRGGDSDRS